jgi:hypothetical protein
MLAQRPSRGRIMQTALVPTALATALLIAGCATPVKHIDGPMQEYDKNTQYTTVDRPDGFSIEVRYARYQLIPESDVVAIACKSAVTSIAYDVADKRGRKLAPINEQRIQLSMGRNGLTGITSCRAMAVAEYAK